MDGYEEFIDIKKMEENKKQIRDLIDRDDIDFCFIAFYPVDKAKGEYKGVHIETWKAIHHHPKLELLQTVNMKAIMEIFANLEELDTKPKGEVKHEDLPNSN